MFKAIKYLVTYGRDDEMAQKVFDGDDDMWHMHLSRFGKTVRDQYFEEEMNGSNFEPSQVRCICQHVTSSRLMTF